MTETDKVQYAVTLAVAVIVDSARSAGADGIPSGVLYALLSQLGMSLATYRFILGAMAAQRLIVVECDRVYLPSLYRVAAP